MKITRTMAALAATAGFGLVAVPVLAQDATDTPTDTATEDTTDDASPDTTADPDGADEAPDEATDGDAGTATESSDDDRARGHGRRGGVGTAVGSDLAQELADELGIDVEDVTAALDAIHARWEEERTATMEEFRAEAEERRTAALEDAVADGDLTQGQSDLLTDLWADRAEARESFDLDALTDAQREALDAFRDAVGDELGGPGRPGHGRGAGDRGHGPAARPSDDTTDGSDAPGDATVQDSALLTT